VALSLERPRRCRAPASLALVRGWRTFPLSHTAAVTFARRGLREISGTVGFPANSKRISIPMSFSPLASRSPTPRSGPPTITPHAVAHVSASDECAWETLPSSVLFKFQNDVRALAPSYRSSLNRLVQNHYLRVVQDRRSKPDTLPASFRRFAMLYLARSFQPHLLQPAVLRGPFAVGCGAGPSTVQSNPAVPPTSGIVEVGLSGR